ncbi:MAG: type II toxin-antitoxin system VapC family toxin [Aestuariivirga sp.]
MILVDTNVVSEPLKAAPDANVIEWFKRNSPDTLFFSAVGVAELMRGVAILPEGRRKNQMAKDLQFEIDRLFAARILPFDESAAHAYAGIHGKMRAIGRAIGILDSQIAAIALARGLSVATRDIQPFLDAGVSVINP